jgi:HPt (histidine-containing phosphotransfer) domain-containing protein
MLSSGWQPGKENLWCNEAHALKGSAFNLGAEQLGQLCKDAQDSFAESPEKKQVLLIAVQQEFAQVRAQLEKLLAALAIQGHCKGYGKRLI